GGFLTVETLVLGAPGVIARWSEVGYAGVVPWVVFATALPLLPAVREAMGQFLKLFDERLRGWILLLLLVVFIVAGNRLGTIAGTATLVVGQFLLVLLVWWIPTP